MIDSQLEIIAQGKRYLQHINKRDYQQILAPHFSSSAGAHMRHILDHYLALVQAKQDVIDYNVRERHAPVEHNPQAAVEKWLEIEHWLRQLSTEEMHNSVQVVSEISVSKTQDAQCGSTLARELVFVSSHAIHHFSLLAVMATLQGKPVEADLGIAPSTASYMRNQQHTAS